MKVAIMIHLFPPKWVAGTEIATYCLAEHLSQRGHEVHVITSYDDDLPKNSFENGFNIHRLSFPNIYLFGIIFFWIGIIRKLHEIKPDIVHAQSLGIGIPALVSKKLLKTPYAVWGRGGDVYVQNWFHKITSKIIIKNADQAIALTEHMRMAMISIYDCEIIVVPNGINIEPYKSKSVSQMDNFERKILFVGRLNPVKGIKYLLQAMKLIHSKIPEAKLIIVGDGKERILLENLTEELGISECVNFEGKIPNDCVLDYMYQADIFVLSSLSEGFPVTVLEAMSSGLPIVATRVGGMPDIIEEGVNGYLAEPKNSNDLADKILILLENDVLRNKMSKNNIKKVKIFSLGAIASKLIKIYKSIATNGWDYS